MNRIFLVRHAQSVKNVNKASLYNSTNISAPLTDIGQNQAEEAGDFLVNTIKNLNESHPQTIKIWNSPYIRTRQTAEWIKRKLAENQLDFIEEESIYISERQFGILDDNPNIHQTHPHEMNHYNIHSKQKHEFWARPPLGESAFDMCMRLDFFIQMILAEDKNKYENHILVSHGASVRGFIMMQQKWTFEQYTEMKNPPNASVQLIDNEQYKGIVFTPKQITG